MVQFAVQKEKRLPGLAAHAIYSISTGKLEGFNNKIKVAKRIGYGYLDSLSFYFFCPFTIPQKNLFFRVTRMTDEDGRIERVRDVENIVKMHMRFFKNVNYK